ncbi:MAG: hypothetical protein FD170_3945 [Bacteroidetes bacterium]|nr:MAG: hypothetical protein FD170_3945 [Bacteroidota bacterium]
MDLKMKIKKYRLLRKRITIDDFEHHPYIKPDDSHLIAVELMHDGNKFTTNSIPINPVNLRIYVQSMLRSVALKIETLKSEGSVIDKQIN